MFSVGAAKIFIVSVLRGSLVLVFTNICAVMQGHATGQTTGIAGHIAARFIPTVERESIDLM